MASLTSPRFKGNRRLEQAAYNQPVMKRGETDKTAVRILQEALLDLGFRMPLSTKAIPLNGLPRSEDLLVADGIYGDETAKTVADYQSARQLARHDGVVGAETLEHLDAEFQGLAKLIRRFKRVGTEPSMAAPQPGGGFRIGGRFDVTAVFAQDPLGQQRRFEYRQFISGRTLVNGQPRDVIRVYPRGAGQGGRPIGPRLQEDGGRFVGPYGHRSQRNQDNDKYFVVDPDALGLREDRTNGSLYRNYDRWGVNLDATDRLRFAGQAVVIDLAFEGRIVECWPVGGNEVQVLRTIRWPEHAAGTVPR